MEIKHTETEIKEMFEKILGKKIETNRHVGNEKAYYNLVRKCIFEFCEDVKAHKYKDIMKSPVYWIVENICFAFGYEVGKEEECSPKDILKYYEDEENKKMKTERN